MENCNSALWFVLFSLAVRREESNPGAQLCWWLLWRGEPADPRSHCLPASLRRKQLCCLTWLPSPETAPSLLRGTAAFSLLRSPALSQTSVLAKEYPY